MNIVYSDLKRIRISKKEWVLILTRTMSDSKPVTCLYIDCHEVLQSEPER